MINNKDWKTFVYDEIFDIKNGFYNKKPESNEEGEIPFLGATDSNNGITSYHTMQDIIDASKTGDDNNAPIEEKIFPAHSVCVTNNGSVGYAYYQSKEFTCSHDVNPLYRKDGIPFNHRTGLFVATVIMKDRYRWQYGRKWRPTRMIKSTIDLPADQDGNPDWEFMENYIKEIENKEKEKRISIKETLNTRNKNNKIPELKVEKWEEFILKNLFNIKYGVNLELNKCIESECGVNFVSRTGENNGVSAKVEKFDNIEPQKAGLITVAGGGSVLSTFLQNRPFYSGRDLYTLELKKLVSDETKLFIVTVIKQNKYKYNYGRQANKTLPDLEIKLPIKRDGNGEPIIDNDCTYSSKGYIPDWEFMENYIKSLPYGDKI